ncbi:unnamed protein product, partial [Rotaria sordida]
SDPDKAIEAAEKGFQYDSPWRQLDPAARAQLIHKLADLLPRAVDYLAKLETLNSEKLLQESYCQILGVAVCLDYYAGCADKITGETFPSESSIFTTYIRHESVGIYEQVISWSVQTFNN